MLTPFFKYLKKSILTNLKKPRTIFCSYPFQIFKKAYLQNLKRRCTIFWWYPFSNIKKSIFTNLKNTWNNFFVYTLFQILKKVYLQISNRPSAMFLLIPNIIISFYFFSSLYIRMNEKSINFNDKKIKKATFIIKTKKN